MRKRIRIIICLLVTLCLFADCHTDPPEDVIEPFAPPAREIPASITEIEEEEPQPAEEPQAITYVLNTNTKKFHKPACRSVGQIKPSNRSESTGAREDVLALGYKPCGNCRP